MYGKSAIFSESLKNSAISPVRFDDWVPGVPVFEKRLPALVSRFDTPDQIVPAVLQRLCGLNIKLKEAKLYKQFAKRSELHSIGDLVHSFVPLCSATF